MLLLLLPTVERNALFSACEPDKENEVVTVRSPDDLTVLYNLFYDAKKDTTLAAVAFCNGVGCGGNSVFLSPGETITFNGAPLLNEDTLYVKRFKGFLPSGTFVWKTSDGRTFTNEIQIDPVAFSPDFNTINRNADLQLTWVGKPVQTSETVMLFFSLPNSSGVFESQFSSEQEGAQSLTVPSSELRKIQTPLKEKRRCTVKSLSHFNKAEKPVDFCVLFTSIIKK